MPIFSSNATKIRAAELGFNLVGIAPAAPSPRLDAYFQWIAANMHGEMGYMAREDRQIRRRDLNHVLYGAKSIIMVGLDYHALQPSGFSMSQLSDPSRGRIASYAWGADYHTLMTPRLEQLATWVRESGSQEVHHKVYVDTGAILERSHAQQAGVGFIGKNTMLINPRRGSYFFLGEIITDAEFDTYDPAHRETMCGNCTRCQTACPTNAFPAPYTLDARRCISYLTIEHKGWIDRNLRPHFGNWVYGCDVCQEVCPFSRFVVPTHEPTFIPATIEHAAPSISDLLQLDESTFRDHFKNSPILRIGITRMLRNACIAAGNSGNLSIVPLLTNLLHHPELLVRGHSAWALGKLGSSHAVLHRALQYEQDESVRDEINYALSIISS